MDFEGSVAILDACVLVPPYLCDLLLRLAERPALYRPLWSAQILDEVGKAQVEGLGFPLISAQSWRGAVDRAFPGSSVSGYEPRIEECRNDVKDRHVLAAAIHGEARVIVTINLRDFPPVALEPWSVAAIHPSEYLTILYNQNPALFVAKISAMSQKRGRTLVTTLAQLAKTVPSFTTFLATELGIDL